MAIREVLAQRVSQLSLDEFYLGHLRLSVAPEDVQISRHENLRFLSWLRELHSVKLNTGRAQFRVDIRFRLPIDYDLNELQALVAMARIAPFVPVRNRYLVRQLGIYAYKQTVNDRTETTDDNSASNFDEDDTIPMAILGLNLVAGGDSPEIVEGQMSFLYWNPSPFIGVEKLKWRQSAYDNLVDTIGRYIDRKVNGADLTSPPEFFGETNMLWWDIMPFRQLCDSFCRDEPDIENQPEGKSNLDESGTLQLRTPDLPPARTNSGVVYDKAIDDVNVGPSLVTDNPGARSIQVSGDRDGQSLDQYLQRIKALSPDDAITGIAFAESRNNPAALNPGGSRFGAYQFSRQVFRNIFFPSSGNPNRAISGDVAEPVRNVLRREFTSLGDEARDDKLRDLVFGNEGTSRWNKDILQNNEKFYDFIKDKPKVQEVVAREYMRGFIS